jgi:AraC-like DNA-binding protein
MFPSSSQLISQGLPDEFGCQLECMETGLRRVGNDIKIYRKKSGPSPVQVVMPANNRGFLVGISMAEGHTRKIYERQTEASHIFDVGSVYVRGFDDDYRAELSGAFDFVLLEISALGLQSIAENVEIGGVERLKAAVAVPDPTLGALVATLFFAPYEKEMSALFVDHVSHAIGLHVVKTYGGGKDVPLKYRRTLSPVKTARVKEMLSSGLGGDISIDELATACAMTRGVFLEAFKNTTGKTPFSWILGKRMETARALLSTPNVSLAQIATLCGYRTQSQFTSAFRVAHGEPPGVWRKRRAL